MAYVFKRPDRDDWYIQFTGADGKRKRIRAGTTKAAADDLLRRIEPLANRARRGLLDDLELLRLDAAALRTLLADIGCSEDQVNTIGARIDSLRPKQLTVSAMVDAWVAHATDKKSLDNDTQRLSRAVEFFGAERPISTITAEDLVAYRDHLREAVDVNRERKERPGRKPRQPKRMSPTTCNRHLVVLRSAFLLAEKRGYKTQQPTSTLKIAKENNERDRIATPEELALIRKHAPPEMLTIFEACTWTAGRLSEVMNIETTDLDFAQEKVTFRETKNGETRTVPLPKPAADALKKWMAKRPARLDRRLFTTSPKTISSAFTRFTRKLGIEDLHIHDMRHYRLTELRRGGADLFVLQAISGHKTLEMLKRYAKVRVEDMQEAAKRAGGTPFGGTR